MSVIAITSKPDDLLSRIRSQIDAGNIDTWEYDDAGDFTHVPDQWHRRAWLHPIATPSGALLTFKLIARENAIVTPTIYGVYHGRFIEMLVTHFENEFEYVRTQRQPIPGSTTTN